MAEPDAVAGAFGQAPAPPLTRPAVYGGALEVPPEFYTFQAGTLYAAGGLTQSQLLLEQKAQMHLILKHFARDLLAGVFVDVLLDDGTVVPCSLKMDGRMTTLTLCARGMSRRLSLHEIHKVCAAEELRNIRTSNAPFVDEKCVTLVLRSSGQFVTFRLADVHIGQYFSWCLRILCMAVLSPREELQQLGALHAPPAAG